MHIIEHMFSTPHDKIELLSKGRRIRYSVVAYVLVIPTKAGLSWEKLLNARLANLAVDNGSLRKVQYDSNKDRYKYNVEVVMDDLSLIHKLWLGIAFGSLSVYAAIIHSLLSSISTRITRSNV